MSSIQLYSTKIEVDTVDNKTLSVYLENVDASDFVNEFTVDEILSAMDFSDIFDWAMANKGEDDE